MRESKVFDTVQQSSTAGLLAKKGSVNFVMLETVAASAIGLTETFTRAPEMTGQTAYSQYYQQVSYQPIVYSGARGPGR